MQRVVVLTGAGISADSGLKTFRDSNGLWEGHDINEVATPQAWQVNPQKVLQFYNERRAQAHQASPNAAHKALVKLEEKVEVNIITQNVDALHERAGSSSVLHLHGELHKVRSEKDASIIKDIGGDAIKIGDTASDGAQLRPHVVWFGEAVPNMDIAASLMPKADLLFVIGTSLAVYPAASLVNYVDATIPKFIVDPKVPEVANPHEWEHIKEQAATGVPKLVSQILSKN